MIFPVINYIRKRKRKVSDIEFLATKEFDGKLRENEGTQLGATGDLATLTANTGKDMYLARAKISVRHDLTGATAQAYKVELKVNATVVETAIGTFRNVQSQNTTLTTSYEFKNIGQKVAAGQVIKLEVVSIGSDIEIEGFISCFEEDTGDSPQI